MVELRIIKGWQTLKAPVLFTTADGYRIAGHRYDPSTPAKANVVIAGATAVPQGFYQRFAQFANDHGFSAVTLDYRGVGLSAPKHLRGFRMNYLDWARQDLAAAIEAIHDPSRPTYLIGHSYGGHAFGLLPNFNKITKLCTFGTGAGWAGYMPPVERIKVALLWNVVGPLTTPIFGYMHGKISGVGENLPIDVYHQWRRWCQSPNYFFDDLTIRDDLLGFSRIKAPIRAVVADDDLWAGPTSRDAFFKNYTAATIESITLNAKVLGYPIGHMGYFRKGREALWLDALAWFACPC